MLPISYPPRKKLEVPITSFCEVLPLVRSGRAAFLVQTFPLVRIVSFRIFPRGRTFSHPIDAFPFSSLSIVFFRGCSFFLGGTRGCPLCIFDYALCDLFFFFIRPLLAEGQLRCSRHLLLPSHSGLFFPFWSAILLHLPPFPVSLPAPRYPIAFRPRKPGFRRARLDHPPLCRHVSLLSFSTGGFFIPP